MSNSSSSSSISSKTGSKVPRLDEEDGHRFPFQVPQPIGSIDDAVANAGYSFDDIFNQAKHNNLNPMAPSDPSVRIVSMEDDEFDSEDERFNDHGPFVDLNNLNERPAHLAVFLHYLISNSDPAPLLFWLVTGIYSQETGSGKDWRRWAYEIFSTFVGSCAVSVTICINKITEVCEKLLLSSVSDKYQKENPPKFTYSS